MARMANASSPRVMTMAASGIDCHFELVPKDALNAEPGHSRWSIDDEPIGETWHDSSWMLRKGLDVIEELDLEPMRRDFGLARFDVTDVGFEWLSLASEA